MLHQALRSGARRHTLRTTALFGMFGKPAGIPEAKDCLPGRDKEMPISNAHYVTKNPIKGPFPDNLEVSRTKPEMFLGVSSSVVLT